MAQSRKVCIFCGGYPLSGEHVFADWIQDYIPLRRQGYESLTESIGESGISYSTKRHPGDPKSKKVKVVCVPCNTKWMSQLQNDTKPFLVPLLLGKNVSLDRRAQTLIAAWATMFTMVAERFDTNQKMISIPDRQLVTFKRTKRPPKGWKVWIAPMSEDSNGSVSRSAVPVSAPDKMPERGADGRDLANTQTTTLLIGKVLIHTFSSVHASVVRRKSLAGTTQIWPLATSPILWNTKRTLASEGADRIAEWLPVKGRQKAASLLLSSK